MATDSTKAKPSRCLAIQTCRYMTLFKPFYYDPVTKKLHTLSGGECEVGGVLVAECPDTYGRGVPFFMTPENAFSVYYRPTWREMTRVVCQVKVVPEDGKLKVVFDGADTFRAQSVKVVKILPPGFDYDFLAALSEHGYPLDLGNNLALNWACMTGRVKAVEALLEDECVDPTKKCNNAIRLASVHGRIKVVNALLKDKRVNPGDLENQALGSAAWRGHIEVVKALLNDERVNPRHSNVIWGAYQSDNPELRKMVFDAAGLNL